MYFLKFLKSPTQHWSGPLVFLIDPSLRRNQIEYKGYVQISNKLYKDTFAGFQPVAIEIELMNERFASGKFKLQTSEERLFSEWLIWSKMVKIEENLKKKVTFLSFFCNFFS